MNVVLEGRGPQRLDPDGFIAAGGEGKVYALGAHAVKIYDDPSKVPPPDKLRRLARIDDPRVVAPIARVTTADGQYVGYYMPLVERGVALSRVCTPAFVQRRRWSNARLRGIAESVRQVVEIVHAAGVTIVDLSDHNILLDADARTPRLIDVDSWQTEDHPATAITPTIRDPRTPASGFCAATDWFSFAVVAFSLLVGIHPFKGKHPRVPTLPERMREGLSVFEPDVRVPACCRDLAAIPAEFATWCHEIFRHQHREPPPPLVHRGATSRAHRPAPTVHPGPGGIGVAHDPTSSRAWLVPADGSPPVEIPLIVDDLDASEDGILLRCGRRVVEVRPTWVGPRLVALSVLRATVLPHACRLLHRVVWQDVHGATVVSVLGPQLTPQLRVPELDGARPIEAVVRGDTVIVLVKRQVRPEGAPDTGAYDRWSLRLRPQPPGYHATVERDVEPEIP